MWNEATILQVGPFMSLVKVDGTIGRSIVSVDLSFLAEFGQDGLGQVLFELDTPLVEQVDV